jgi:uncharacterized membrane protein (DUF106 family)
MEWAQVLAIVVHVMLAIILGVVSNNRRIDDLRVDIDRRFGEVRQDMKELKEDIREVRTDADRRFGEVRQDMKELKEDIRQIHQVLFQLIPTPFRKEPSKEDS